MENEKTVEENTVKKVGRPKGAKDTQPRKRVVKPDRPPTPPPVDTRTHKQKLYDSWFM